MNPLIWLIVGGLVGWIAYLIMHMHAHRGMLLNLVVGIVGAALIVGGLIAPAVGVSAVKPSHLSAVGLALCLAGAIALVATIKLFRHLRAH